MRKNRRDEKMKWMQLPRYVLVGHGILGKISKVCKKLVLSKRAIVVTGPITREVAGEEVFRILSEANYDVSLIEVDSMNERSIEDVKNIAKEYRADFLIGVGGGRIIDTAKIASYELDIPFISVPTIASHDGIASPRASIKEKGDSVSIQAHAPLAVIADTKIISSAPYRFIAAGCGDIIANFTAVRDWKLAHKLRNVEFSSYAAALSEMTANMIMENVREIRKGGEKASWIVVKALISSGVAISIAGSSAPASGSEHKFSHALDVIAKGKAKTLHGEQCGVGTIMMAHLHGEDWRRIQKVLKEIGAPTNAEDMGVSDEDIIKALTYSHKINPERYTILGDSGLTYEAAEELATVTEVIRR
ncbi:MAG: NAD(P)-dependent glycerol-1-phosphate dehydrogenase [Candidatus Methanospirareceae archaeon]